MISKSVGLQKESGVRLRVFFVNNSNHYQNSKVRQKKKNFVKSKIFSITIFYQKNPNFCQIQIIFWIQCWKFLAILYVDLHFAELDEALVSQLKHDLSVEHELKSNLFDSLQSRCFSQLTTDSLLYPGFRNSKFYIEMLRRRFLGEHKFCTR